MAESLASTIHAANVALIMVISRLQDGVIAEEWACSDLAERLLLARKREAKPA